MVRATIDEFMHPRTVRYRRGIVSERLGHASATITWDIYQHVTPAMQSDAAERVAKLIFRPRTS